MKRFGNAVWITLRAVSLYSCSGERTLKMNPNTQSLKAIENEGIAEPVVSEVDTLVERGFTPDEIISLVWLRDWYQSGGSDRVEVIRHLEFLKLLVMNGKMAL
jgi:hypothetical protein